MLLELYACDKRIGLTSHEVQKRRSLHGKNDLDIHSDHSLFRIILNVAKEPMFLLLLAAGIIYLLMGDIHEAFILLGFILIIITVTALQEQRTENVLKALRNLSSPRALVLRDGQSVRIAGWEVVPDDIVLLSEGDRTPADGQILSAHECSVDESMLTGESFAIAKSSESLLFAGTLMVSGQCIMKVTAIGMTTEMGKIGKSLQSIDIQTSPLQEKNHLLARRLAIIGIGLCLLVIALHFFSRGPFFESVLAGITLAMGILPQEFPVIMIVFMAFGARRIAAFQVLTRRLNAIETLGETTVLCVDKTGTLTQNRMSVKALYIPEQILNLDGITALPEEFHSLVEYALLASELDPHDQMEKAVHTLALKHLAETEHIHLDWHLSKEYELSPELMAMSHLWRVPDQTTCIIATKGAPEAIIDLCHLSAPDASVILHYTSMMAQQGLRVLAVGKAIHVSDSPPEHQHDFDYTFLGLVGLFDPIKEDVAEAIQVCHQAGIKVVMITGDYPITAAAIAKQAGIDDRKIATGAEIEKLSSTGIKTLVRDTTIFARVSPKQKLMIVEALKDSNEIVAMTGDGVNDAPALKAAHIGIAMGQRGTDVAREAASIVLLDDSFSSIVATIRQGRRIFANLRKAMIYTLAVHIPIIGLSLMPLLFGLPLVLAPIHIAFLELVIDPTCSIAFEAQEPDRDMMRLKPRPVNEPLLSSTHIIYALLQGGLASLLLFIFYTWLLHTSNTQEYAKTMLFVALIASNTALILSNKSHQRLTMRTLFGSWTHIELTIISITLLTLIIVTILDFFRQSFMFVNLSFGEWLLAFSIGISTLILFESVKMIFSRKLDLTV